MRYCTAMRINCLQPYAIMYMNFTNIIRNKLDAI